MDNNLGWVQGGLSVGAVAVEYYSKKLSKPGQGPLHTMWKKLKKAGPSSSFTQALQLKGLISIVAARMHLYTCI